MTAMSVSGERVQTENVVAGGTAGVVRRGKSRLMPVVLLSGLLVVTGGMGAQAAQVGADTTAVHSGGSQQRPAQFSSMGRTITDKDFIIPDERWGPQFPHKKSDRVGPPGGGTEGPLNDRPIAHLKITKDYTRFTLALHDRKNGSTHYFVGYTEGGPVSVDNEDFQARVKTNDFQRLIKETRAFKYFKSAPGGEVTFAFLDENNNELGSMISRKFINYPSLSVRHGGGIGEKLPDSGRGVGEWRTEKSLS